ncbi:FecR domain-containing protein [Pleurocapsales cyanobacterium LEGE 10410]|nr:FecR domain-containing protein [Pleurocapsales cyanobacterium LEGE 10410]
MQQFFNSHRSVFRLSQKLIASIFIACLASNSASASTALKQAEIYKIRNRVDINYGEQPGWDKAELGDVIEPRDSVRTGANSRADILFDEGTLVRTGAGTTFRFPQGKRSFELTSGAALIIIRPEQGQSTVNTPEAKIVSQGTALFVQHDPQSSSSLIGVLTNSPAGLVKVSSADGDVTLQLQAGEFITVVRGIVGLVQHFVLPMFYETVELSAGLGSKPEDIEAIIARESPEVQATLRAVQAEAIEPLKNQTAWLQGLCKLNVGTENLSPLLQLFGIGISDIRVRFEIPENNLSIVPFRSLSGIAWLGQHCREAQNLPELEN